MGDTPFATVHDLNSRDRKYAYIIWKLSGDRGSLKVRSVDDKVIPKAQDSASMVALLTKNTGNPQLSGEEIEFKKQK